MPVKKEFCNTTHAHEKVYKSYKKLHKKRIAGKYRNHQESTIKKEKFGECEEMRIKKGVLLHGNTCAGNLQNVAKSRTKKEFLYTSMRMSENLEFPGIVEFMDTITRGSENAQNAQFCIPKKESRK